MAIDPVPFAIGNNQATLSADTLRAAAYAFMGGAEGVTSVGDFKVTATPTPGPNVRAAAGGASLLNRSSGGTGQLYSVRAGTSTDVPVTATGATAATRYVIIRIDDPQFGGTASGSAGPYDFVEVVDALPVGKPFLLLAQINQPANTATITSAMIVDKRIVARPRRQSIMFTYAVTAANASTLDNTGAYPAGGKTWPVATETAWGTIDIPAWASYVKIVMTWAGVRVPGGNATGAVWVQVGATVDPNNFKTQSVLYNTEGVTNVSRTALIAADTMKIPAALRGTAQKFYPRGNVDAAVASAARLSLDGGSALTLELEFIEVAD